MVDEVSDDTWRAIIENDNKVLDIAGKAGEFALAVYEKYTKLGFEIDEIKDLIFTIPTSGITYEFARMIYEILGLNIKNIATKFTVYSLLTVTDNEQVDYNKIKKLITQNKSFDCITLDDEITEEDDKVNFDVVIGNPPYQEEDITIDVNFRSMVRL